MEDLKDKSIYALLIGAAVGFAGGAYLFSSKESSLRKKIEEEISQFYQSNVKLDDTQKQEIDKIKVSLLSILNDLSMRIKNSMSDGKEDQR